MVEFANGVLWNLSLDETVRKDIAADSGVRVIINGLRSYPGSSVVQRSCCGTLWNLALDDACLPSILSSGGVEALVGAMRTHGGSSEVQGALWSLSADIAGRGRIMEVGGVQVLLATLWEHQQSAEVLAKGLGTLRNIASELDNAAVENSPVVDAVVVIAAALVAHKDCVEVQAQGCGALWTLSLQDLGRETMAAAGVLGVLTDAMTRHLLSLEIQKSTLGALNNLLHCGPPESSGDQAVLTAVVDSMKQWPRSAHVQQLGCSALSLLLATPAMRTVATGGSGAVDYVRVDAVATVALRAFTKHGGVRLAARALLKVCSASAAPRAA